ncbi:MAG TPA: ABC transporter permease [Gemmatimonadaceae bacterium]|nr:ABC transporter permease [Gemmatimonadaceae bacterium]
METFLQDVRYAGRTLRKNPAFTLIAVICLALGIATNTTLFSCFNAIVLRPFPFTDPDHLVALSDFNPKTGYRDGISYLNYLDWRDQARSFTGVAAWSGRSVAITEGTDPARLSGELITANLFPLLGIRPQLGRLFREDEDVVGAPGVALLGDAAWKRLYDGDPSVVGRVISINNEPHTVVGIMPPDFKFPDRGEIWLPMAPLLHAEHRDWRSLDLIGRLKSGTTLAQANAELKTLTTRLKTQYGVTNDDQIGNARPLRELFLGNDVKLVVSAMMGAVTFVLLIAIANVANLMLTRAAGRQRELAIRSAIGAARFRIVRQLLTEAVIIALAAGVLSVPLAWEGLRLVNDGIPPENPVPYYMQWSLDAPTLLYTAVISLITGALFGLAPALQASRGQLTEALKDGARGASGGARHNRLRSALVVAEVALSLVLLVGASLFVRTFVGLRHVAVGFDPSRILTMRFYLPGTRYDSSRTQQEAVNDIMRRVTGLPGIEAATISNMIPLGGGGGGDHVIIDGQTVEKGKEPYLLWTGVAGHWMQTFGVKIESGRDFTDAELRDSTRLAVIDQTMALKLWPKADAVGKRFRLTSDTSRQWYTVIGVAHNMRITTLDNNGPPRPSAFLPYHFLPARNNGLMVRVQGNASPTSVTSAVRRAIRGADATLPVFSVQTMEKVRSLSFWQYGLFGAMFGAFGVLALVLAAIGVYGVISYGVAQRTREFGVRVALGAQRGDVIGLVVRQGMALASLGIVLGVVGAFGVTRVVKSLLIGVSPTDPISFLGVGLFLCLVALLASAIPARRATVVDPIVALRVE